MSKPNAVAAKLIRGLIVFASLEFLWMPLVSGAEHGGSVDAAVSTAVNQHKRAIRACSEHFDPTSHGKITSVAHIDTAGQVTSITVSSSLSADVTTCIESTIKQWQFPALPAAYDANFSVIL